MIYGVGIDLVEVYRVQRLLDRWGDKFIKRCFSPLEIVYCGRKENAAMHYAARFAVKEAFLKCLGIGLVGGVSMRDIGVVRTAWTKPELLVKGKALSLMNEKGILSVSFSMSHSKEYAAAIVTLEM